MADARGHPVARPQTAADLAAGGVELSHSRSDRDGRPARRPGPIASMPSTMEVGESRITTTPSGPAGVAAGVASSAISGRAACASDARRPTNNWSIGVPAVEQVHDRADDRSPPARHAGRARDRAHESTPASEIDPGDPHPRGRARRGYRHPQRPAIRAQGGGDRMLQDRFKAGEWCVHLVHHGARRWGRASARLSAGAASPRGSSSVPWQCRIRHDHATPAVCGARARTRSSSAERTGAGAPVLLLHGLTATRRYVLHGFHRPRAQRIRADRVRRPRARRIVARRGPDDYSL